MRLIKILRLWRFLGAAKRGNLIRVRFYIQDGLDVNTRFPVTGETSLYAAVTGHSDPQTQESIVRLLLSNGADPNLGLKSGVTPLMAAARRGNVRIMRILLDSGSNPNSYSAVIGTTPIIAAIENANLETLILLIQRGADVNLGELKGPSFLQSAIVLGSIEHVNVLLKAGADVNYIHPIDGGTPLIDAASIGVPEIIRLLIESGADPRVKDKTGKTALDYSIEGGFKEAEIMLRKALECAI